jgi:hypothetical protein
MMSPKEILEQMQALGIELIVEGQKLRWRPRSAVTPAIRMMIVQRKQALIALLSGSVSRTPQNDVDCEMRSSTSGQAAEIDGDQAIWVLHPNGYPEKVYTPMGIPPGVTHWCREGDPQWRRIHRVAVCHLPPRMAMPGSYHD